VATGENEARYRVVCHLPVNNAEQEIVIFEFLKLLKELKNIEGAEIGGFTMSRVESPVFFGYWWFQEQKKWARDKLILCYIDYKIDPDRQAVSEIIRQLKQSIEDLYRTYSNPEEEIWVVAHPVVRHQ
jgi:hypothetical protein